MQPSFKYDQHKPTIRPFNYERLVPTKPLTDRGIVRWAILGKYGPDVQKQYVESARHKTKVKRIINERKKTLKQMLEDLEY